LLLDRHSLKRNAHNPNPSTFTPRKNSCELTLTKKTFSTLPWGQVLAVLAYDGGCHLVIVSGIRRFLVEKSSQEDEAL